MTNDSDKQQTLHVPLKGAEVDKFEAAFAASGFRTQTEFVRFLVNQYLMAIGRQ